uniref:Uncharacterized protein n=1 Tax=Romanomermis culicivorax TaxID=13658 RepID=A0A915K7V1_ROMCU
MPVCKVAVLYANISKSMIDHKATSKNMERHHHPTGLTKEEELNMMECIGYYRGTTENKFFNGNLPGPDWAEDTFNVLRFEAGEIDRQIYVRIIVDVDHLNSLKIALNNLNFLERFPTKTKSLPVSFSKCSIIFCTEVFVSLSGV